MLDMQNDLPDATRIHCVVLERSIQNWNQLFTIPPEKRKA